MNYLIFFLYFKAFVKKRTNYLLREENENEYENEDSQNLNWPNVFRVYLLVSHLLISFFGTGNMASLNSFDTASVYCFVTVFNPFVMGSLLLLKVIAPFLMVIVAFYCIYEMIDLSIGKLYILLMVISDLMALVIRKCCFKIVIKQLFHFVFLKHFFFLIRTEGSWMDIGISISHYLLVVVKILAISIFFSIAQYLFKFEMLKVNLVCTIRNRLVKSD